MWLDDISFPNPCRVISPTLLLRPEHIFAQGAGDLQLLFLPRPISGPGGSCGALRVCCIEFCWKIGNTSGIWELCEAEQCLALSSGLKGRQRWGNERGKSVPVDSTLSFSRGAPEQSPAGGRTKLPTNASKASLLEGPPFPRGSRSPQALKGTFAFSIPRRQQHPPPRAASEQGKPGQKSSRAHVPVRFAF